MLCCFKSVLAASVLLTLQPSTTSAVRTSHNPIIQSEPNSQEIEQLFGAINVALTQRDFPSARRSIQTAIGRVQAIRGTARKAKATYKLAGFCEESGSLDQASDLSKNAIDLYSRLGDLEWTVNSLLLQGRIRGALLDTAGGIECHKRAVALAIQRGRPKNLPGALAATGNFYALIGEFEKGRELLERASTTFQKFGDWIQVARCRINVANCQLGLGDYARAIDNCDRALHALGDPAAVVETQRQGIDLNHSICAAQTNIAEAYAAYGRTDLALQYFNDALAHSRKDSVSMSAEVEILEKLALTCRSMGLSNEALDRCRDAEKVASPRHLRDELANLWLMESQILLDRHEDSEALRLVQAARRVYSQMNHLPRLAATLHQTGRVCAVENRHTQAISFYSQALELRISRRNHLESAETLVARAESLAALGHDDDAQADYSRAMEEFDAAARLVPDPTLIGRLQQTILHANKHYAQLLIKHGKQTRALEVLERGRARGLAVLSEARGDASVLIPANERSQLTRATSLVRRYRQELESAVGDAAALRSDERAKFKVRKRQAEARLSTAESALSSVQLVLLSRHAPYRRALGRAPVRYASLESLAQSNPETLYLDWAVGEKSTMVFALNSKGLHTLQLSIGEAALEDKVRNWQSLASRLLPDSEARERMLASDLFRILLQPVEKAGLLSSNSHQRVCVVADGPLLDLPFHALLDSHNRRLVTRLTFSYAFSLGTLAQGTQRRIAARSILSIADPLGREQVALRSVERGAFGPLPHARKEGAAVAALFPSHLLLVGRAARETRVKSEVSRWDILHFATHGYLDSTQGLRSSMVLAKEPANSTEDGFLEAREILGLRLRARLAVLSGCRTGAGQKSGGEGIVGLSWAFRAAGCPSIIASKWQVNDEATGVIMKSFYSNLRHGMRKDEALRKAMADLSADQRHKSPYYWAAFQLIGEPGAL